MLELAKDYVPIEKRAKPIDKAYQHDVSNKYEAAERIGKSRNYFTQPTKLNRFRSLLGAGDMEEGYKKYLTIVDNTIDEYSKMCEALKNSPWGFKVLDHLQGKGPTYTQKLAYQIDLHGMTTYKKLMSARRVLKYYRRLEKIKASRFEFLPMDERLPLTEKFIKKYYWREKMTTGHIAEELAVSEVWVQNEVRRLGMQKKPNGIKLRGKKGFSMPEEQKVKHRNQPHARAVVQICPRTFTVLRRWNATGAVERDGWSRANVRKAIKSAGIHDGFLWAYEGKEKEIIDRARSKGNLEKKLKIWENGHIEKELLYELYIVQDLNKEQIASKLGCTPGAVASRASKFGFKKRVNISTETLKTLYIDQGLQAKEIAEMYGYSAKSISTYLSRRGITKYKKMKEPS